MRSIRRTEHLIRGNMPTLVAFELLFKAWMAAVMVLLVHWGFELALRLSGYAYLTRENVSAFFLRPVTLAIAALLCVVAISLTVIDSSAVVYILDRSAMHARCSVRRTLSFALRSGLRIWKPANLPMAGLLMLLAPFLNVSLICGVLATVSLPDFVLESIRLNPGLYALLVAALLLLAMLLTRWLYTFHYFALEEKGFGEAARCSAALNRGRRLKDYGIMFLTQALFTLGVVLLLLLLTVLAWGLGRLLNTVFHRQWLVSSMVWYAAVLSLGIVFAFSAPFSYGCISQMFYRRKTELQEPIRRPTETESQPRDPVRQKMLRALWVSLAALVASSLLVLGLLLYSGRLNPPVEGLWVTEITAHRGASAAYPENTMAAFRGAWEMGADWIELDVQQTKDGQIIILHDENTQRVTGVAGNVWDMTYEQIAALDAGRRFSRQFAGEPIPLLSQAAEFAREKGMKLNVELKPTGHEVDFEQRVIDILKEYGIQDQCVITSQVYHCLENVKACDPAMTTVYVTSLAYGKLDRLSAADHFSIESTSVTPRLVSYIHKQGKQIYAWTANTRSSIDRMIERNVDNIITDNIELARKRVQESRYSLLLSELVQTMDEGAMQVTDPADGAAGPSGD